MKFEWDPKKDAANQRKHQISFEKAILVFDDPFALIAPDEKPSRHEQRNWIIGDIGSDTIVVVVYTVRNDDIRLISARPAHRKERNTYEAFKRLSF